MVKLGVGGGKEDMTLTLIRICCLRLWEIMCTEDSYVKIFKIDKRILCCSKIYLCLS